MRKLETQSSQCLMRFWSFSSYSVLTSRLALTTTFHHIGGHTRLGHMIMASNKESRFNFIAEPDSALQCVICLDVAEDPRQHEKCGRLFCKECLEEYGRYKPCPNCRRERPQYFEDNKS